MDLVGALRAITGACMKSVDVLRDKGKSVSEVVFDFYDRLKSVTKGYASFDYQMIGYQQDFLVKMQILVNDEPVDALSVMLSAPMLAYP